MGTLEVGAPRPPPSTHGPVSASQPVALTLRPRWLLTPQSLSFSSGRREAIAPQGKPVSGA
ncbi:hypothetical protein P7K49_003390, partial [Saguinus oedipus]